MELARFEAMETDIVAVSVDSVPCLTAWAESLGGVTYPLASDFWPHGEAARAYGVLREEDGYAERAIFLVDREGTVRYVDIHPIDDQPDNEVLFAEIAKLEPELAKTPAAGPAASGVPETGGDLVMYCTPWCPDCRNARHWLDSRGIDYVEIDVSTDVNARKRAASHNDGRLHTPTFELGDEICIDFRPDRLRELLGLAAE